MSLTFTGSRSFFAPMAALLVVAMEQPVLLLAPCPRRWSGPPA